MERTRRPLNTAKRMLLLRNSAQYRNELPLQLRQINSKHHMAASQLKQGQAVWLDLRNVDTGRPNKKMDWLHGKCKVLKEVEPMVDELDLPTGIHNHFFTDLLRLAEEKPLPSQYIH